MNWTEITLNGLAHPKLTWGLPSLSLTTEGSWVTFKPLVSSLSAVTHDDPLQERLNCEAQTADFQPPCTGMLVPLHKSIYDIWHFTTNFAVSHLSDDIYRIYTSVWVGPIHSLLLTLLIWRQKGHPARITIFHQQSPKGSLTDLQWTQPNPEWSPNNRSVKTTTDSGSRNSS